MSHLTTGFLFQPKDFTTHHPTPPRSNKKKGPYTDVFDKGVAGPALPPTTNPPISLCGSHLPFYLAPYDRPTRAPPPLYTFELLQPRYFDF